MSSEVYSDEVSEVNTYSSVPLKDQTHNELLVTNAAQTESNSVSFRLANGSENSNSDVISDSVMYSTDVNPVPIGGHDFSNQDEIPIQLRQSSLSRYLTNRPPLNDLVKRGLIKPGVSTTLTHRLQKLEKRILRDSISHSLQNRPDMDDLVQRGIQSNPQLTPVLRAKVAGLEMKMRKHMMEQTFSQRPSPLEIRTSHPGVYDSLSEEAKRSIPSTDGTAMTKVYVSFAEATAENLLISGKITAEQYNRLYSICKDESSSLRKRLLEIVRQYLSSNDMDFYEKSVMEFVMEYIVC